MCGIAGFWTRRPREADDLGAVAARMAAVLAHRGPDAQTTWLDAPAGLLRRGLLPGHHKLRFHARPAFLQLSGRCVTRRKTVVVQVGNQAIQFGALDRLHGRPHPKRTGSKGSISVRMDT